MHVFLFNCFIPYIVDASSLIWFNSWHTSLREYFSYMIKPNVSFFLFLSDLFFSIHTSIKSWMYSLNWVFVRMFLKSLEIDSLSSLCRITEFNSVYLSFSAEVLIKFPVILDNAELRWFILNWVLYFELIWFSKSNGSIVYKFIIWFNNSASIGRLEFAIILE